MNKNVLIGIVIVFVLVFAGVFVLRKNKNNTYLPVPAYQSQSNTTNQTTGVQYQQDATTSLDTANQDLNNLEQSLPSDSDLGSNTFTQ